MQQFRYVTAAEAEKVRKQKEAARDKRAGSPAGSCNQEIVSIGLLNFLQSGDQFLREVIFRFGPEQTRIRPTLLLGPV